ncbi:cobalt transporter subunit CbtA [Mesorhizobium albiziae]|uniref:Cobalt transporter subunit CbtA n=1 Tax=Neomesorhizobium albiziae TaxID=335020 RepID=A0A1I3WA95_9HYPH|nr:CbtA family protein [Mesorhizobium albiziae]GLS31481.1 cobalt transporter subunit CbtA [Mesorhizobium albiziae]SFK04488.1 cobalt transporter subunit CbtA [Mesorhizobium albiziae]
MTLFRNVVFVAAIAGLLAGIVMTAMQAYATVPLILQAETFENAEAAPAHDHAEAAPTTDTAAATAPEAAAPAAHDHGEEAWAPADGFERYAYTAAANVVTAIGFALILVAVSEAFGGILSWRQGLFWGFAGFAVFTLAPGLGLPPELPAMPAADLAARQVWWIGTVAATAIGLALIAFRRSAPLAILGLALIVTPHIIGAPQPESHESPIPANLHHQFVVAATVTSLIFWVVLGGLVGLIRGRFMGSETELQRSFA